MYFFRLKFMVNATQGMPGSQGAELFISSDMFYLEVLLESSGVVKDVKIHHEGKTEQQARTITFLKKEIELNDY